MGDMNPMDAMRDMLQRGQAPPGFTPEMMRNMLMNAPGGMPSMQMMELMMAQAQRGGPPARGGGPPGGMPLPFPPGMGPPGVMGGPAGDRGRGPGFDPRGGDRKRGREDERREDESKRRKDEDRGRDRGGGGAGGGGERDRDRGRGGGGGGDRDQRDRCAIRHLAPLPLFPL